MTSTNGNTGGGLSFAEINDILANGKGKNVYAPKLKTFLDSDEAGINPRSYWATELGTKSPSAVFQSFNNQVKSQGLEDTVLVKQSRGEVYLIHKQRYALAAATPTE